MQWCTVHTLTMDNQLLTNINVLRPRLDHLFAQSLQYLTTVNLTIFVQFICNPRQQL